MRICKRNNFEDIKVSGEGRGGGAPGTRAEIALHTMVQPAHGEAAVALQPMEDHRDAEIHLHLWKRPTPERL